jgi:VanZ family protein
MKRWVWLWGPAFAQMALIFALSSLHDAPVPEGMSDHFGHGVGYLMLSVAMFWGFSGASWAGVSWRTALLSVGTSVLYGLSDEFHQMFVPGRAAAWDDVLADLNGALIGAALVGILYIINKLWPTRT